MRRLNLKSACINNNKKILLYVIANFTTEKKKQVKKTEKLFCFTQQGHLCLELHAMNMHNI